MALKIKERDKNEAAVKSFQGTSFLIDEEKIMISKWIHPNKVFIMIHQIIYLHIEDLKIFLINKKNFFNFIQN